MYVPIPALAQVLAFMSVGIAELTLNRHLDSVNESLLWRKDRALFSSGEHGELDASRALERRTHPDRRSQLLTEFDALCHFGSREREGDLPGLPKLYVWSRDQARTSV